MKIKLTEMVLPEQGLVTGKVYEVVEKYPDGVAVKGKKGFSLFVHQNEYVEVKDDS